MLKIYLMKVLFIQEHWLFNFEFKMFKEALPNCSFYALSIMRVVDFARDRGHGGTCVVETKCRCFRFNYYSSHHGDFEAFFSHTEKACVLATEECIPHTGSRGQRNGWSEHLRGTREAATFGHRRRLEDGRPPMAWLADMRTRTRAQCHRAVKLIKNNKERNIRDKVANSLTNASSYQLKVGKIGIE